MLGKYPTLENFMFRRRKEPDGSMLGLCKERTTGKTMATRILDGDEQPAREHSPFTKWHERLMFAFYSQNQN